jgi:Zn-dependent peptidase ImmA (M78 family)
VSLDALRDSEYGQVEHQANVFAANLLMPLDDYRRQIEAQAKVDLDMIGHCADRYRVSLIAAVAGWDIRSAVLRPPRPHCGTCRKLPAP